MKNFFIVIGAGFLFCLVVAAVAANVRLRPWTKPGQEDLYLHLKELVTTPVHDASDSDQPKLVVDREEYDFGTLPPYTSQSCDFVITNEGTAPLVIKDGGTSCKCTMNELSAVRIPPGESFTVTLNWTTKKAEKSFHHFARVLSTDPKCTEIELKIHGEVVESLANDRTEIGVDLLPDESTEQTIKLYSKTWKSLSIEKVELPDNFSCESLPLQSTADECSLASTLRFKAPNNYGSSRYNIRLHIKPPKGIDLQEEASKSLLGIGRVDGANVVIDVPVTIDVKRRVNLYGPTVLSEGAIELGKLLTNTSSGKSWNIVGKIRGDLAPDAITAELTGMDGLAIEVTEGGKTNKSFRLRIYTTKALRPVIYDNVGAHGNLVLKFPGLGDQDKLEMPVYLDVNEGDK